MCSKSLDRSSKMKFLKFEIPTAESLRMRLMIRFPFFRILESVFGAKFKFKIGANKSQNSSFYLNSKFARRKDYQHTRLSSSRDGCNYAIDKFSCFQFVN